MMKKGIILCVDDDEDLQTVLSQYLENDGYKVVTAGGVAGALEKIESQNLNLILLDLTLPDGEGISLIPAFRNKSSAPIIVVSGKSDATEKIVCLEMGADDYVTKPFELRELSARIKAVLRRANDNPKASLADSAPGPEKIAFGNWILDRAQYQLFNRKNLPAGLTTGEFRLIEALLLSPNKVLTRERLFDLTRSQDYAAFDRAIDIQIARLRKKLGKDSKYVKTVRSVGYMFSGETKSA